MLAIKNLVATAILAIATPIMAAPVFLPFEDAPLDTTLVGEFYKNLGIVFSDHAFTVRSYDDPRVNQGGNFRRYSDPSSKAALGMYALGGGTTGFFINIAAGFSGKFTMLYTADRTADDSGFAELFSGVNGTGNVINTGSRPDPAHPGSTLPGAALTRQAPCTNPAGVSQPGVLCTWAEVSLAFTGVAQSVHISGISGAYFYDNLTFGPLADVPPTTDVPEPGGVALSLAALGALAWARKRTQR